MKSELWWRGYSNDYGDGENCSVTPPVLVSWSFTIQKVHVQPLLVVGCWFFAVGNNNVKAYAWTLDTYDFFVCRVAARASWINMNYYTWFRAFGSNFCLFIAITRRCKLFDVLPENRGHFSFSFLGARILFEWNSIWMYCKYKHDTHFSVIKLFLGEQSPCESS